MHSYTQLENLRITFSLKPHIRNDKIISKAVELTKDFPFFTNLIEHEGSYAHYECCKYLKYAFFNKFAYVFHQHEPGDTFFIILEGQVSVLVGPREKTEKIVKERAMTLGKGEAFGERAMMMGLPRAASIFCMTDCHFAVLDRDKYTLLLNKAIEMRFNTTINARIACISTGEVIGDEEIVNNSDSMYTYKCISQNCVVFRAEVENLRRIISANDIIQKALAEQVATKYEARRKRIEAIVGIEKKKNSSVRINTEYLLESSSSSPYKGSLTQRSETKQGQKQNRKLESHIRQNSQQIFTKIENSRQSTSIEFQRLKQRNLSDFMQRARMKSTEYDNSNSAALQSIKDKSLNNFFKTRILQTRQSIRNFQRDDSAEQKSKKILMDLRQLTSTNLVKTKKFFVRRH